MGLMEVNGRHFGCRYAVEHYDSITSIFIFNKNCISKLFCYLDWNKISPLKGLGEFYMEASLFFWNSHYIYESAHNHPCMLFTWFISFGIFVICYRP